MSNATKTVKTAEERVAEKDAKILQLQNEKKKIMQQAKAKERRERNNRLFRRHGLLEKYMPALIAMTDYQFEMFIKRGINTKYGNDILNDILSKPCASTTIAPSEMNKINDNGDSANPPKAEQL